MEQDKSNYIMGRFERWFVRLVPFLLVAAAIMLLVTMTQVSKTKYAVKETAAYTRVTNCIVAKTATRTQDDIERCYIQVEKDSGIALERFDEQRNNENIKD